MNRYPIISSKASQKGIVLLESLIAVLIFSLGVLALAGLQSAMIKSTDDARYRAEATFIAQQKLSELWLNTNSEAGLTSYVGEENVAVVNGARIIPNGTTTVAVDGSRMVTVTVNWQLPGRAQHTYIANARIEGIR